MQWAGWWEPARDNVVGVRADHPVAFRATPPCRRRGEVIRSPPAGGGVAA